MPALEARLTRLAEAHTVPLGISVDSVHSHAAWVHELGGVSFPLLADFHPKGAVAARFGVYLDREGICDRASVLIDADGVVRFTQSVRPSGQRDIEALVARCEALDREFGRPLPRVDPADGLPEDVTLFIKDRCAFSRVVCHARGNLHLEEHVSVRNVSRDPTARVELQRLGGRDQAPALAIGRRVIYETRDIVRYLVEHAAMRWIEVPTGTAAG